MKLKVCGMKHNTLEVAALQPNYLGFIFFEGSPRNYDANAIPKLPQSVKKVGVFVNAPIEFIIEKIEKFNLDVVQLHGDERFGYVKNLKTEIFNRNLKKIKIWKVFSIKNTFNFELLAPFQNIVDAFLFDTKGKSKGGNGEMFNWEVLNNYPSTKPFVLSGGIGLEELSAVLEILKTDLPILALDVNSKFETEPGHKNVESLQLFMKQLPDNDN